MIILLVDLSPVTFLQQYTHSAAHKLLPEKQQSVDLSGQWVLSTVTLHNFRLQLQLTNIIFASYEYNEWCCFEPSHTNPVEHNITHYVAITAKHNNITCQSAQIPYFSFPVTCRSNKWHLFTNTGCQQIGFGKFLPTTVLIIGRNRQFSSKHTNHALSVLHCVLQDTQEILLSWGWRHHCTSILVFFLV